MCQSQMMMMETLHHQTIDKTSETVRSAVLTYKVDISYNLNSQTPLPI